MSTLLQVRDLRKSFGTCARFRGDRPLRTAGQCPTETGGGGPSLRGPRGPGLREGGDVLGRNEAPAQHRLRAVPPAAPAHHGRADGGNRPQSRNHILESIQALSEAGTTVIYTSHYMEEVEAIGDTILIMDHGAAVAEGTTESLKESLGDVRRYSIA